VISEVQTPEVESFNIAAGPEGSVWYTASGAGSLSEVGEIPAGGQPTYFSNGIFQPGQDGEAGELGPITLGPDDNLWFTQSAQPSLRGRFAPPDPAGHSQEPAAIKAWEHSQARPVGSKPVTYVVSFTH
jgi:streptogramin lyase